MPQTDAIPPPEAAAPTPPPGMAVEDFIAEKELAPWQVAAFRVHLAAAEIADRGPRAHLDKALQAALHGRV